jgi:hypothetical protein
MANMIKKTAIALVIFLGLLPAANAAVGRYMVFFTDKTNTTYSVDQPQDFLTQRAIDRRQRQSIGIDPTDLPVSESYVNTLQEAGPKVYFRSRWLNAVLAEFDEAEESAVKALSFVKGIQRVAPGARLSGHSGGRRSGRNEKITHHFQPATAMDALATDEQNSMLDLRQMHQQGFTGDGVLIGVFDSGFATVDTSPYFTHLFTGEQVVATRDFIRNSNNIFQYDTHGTKVLSCIAAYDQTQYIGAAYGADFVLCVTEDIMGEYRVEEYNWLFAAEYADSLGVDVINSSVGYSYFDDPAMDYDYEDMDGETAIITQAALLAARKGMLVVSSNGNEGNSAWTYLNAPADADSILSVGAVNLDGMRANFSSFGPASDGRLKPDVSALGIWTKVVQNDAVVVSNGTSFSSPLIAGLAAGFWQAFPDLSSQEVIQYLKMSASQSTSPDTLTGFGVPSFVRAYSKVKINEGKIDNKFIVFPNPIDTVSGYRYIYIYNDIFSSGAEATFAIYDLKGLLVRELTLLLPEDPNPIELDISGLQPGSYILNCAVGSALQKSKLIVF